MKVLVVGGGGREHAIAWKLAQSPKVRKVYAAPGNPGMADIGECVPATIGRLSELADWAQATGIGLTVVGPEAWLEAGIVDEFERRGLRIFGGSAAAAELETSKVFSKDLMRRYGIPTAAYEVFDDVACALAYLDTVGAPIVVKADGLAAGKGAVVCMDLDSAREAVRQMLGDRVFGAAGSRVVIEEFMVGFEMSLLAFCDGTTVVPMVPVQDHKRAYDFDGGPNTGGMGTYSPVPQVTESVVAVAMETILIPTVRAMEAEGRTYKGVLYAGLMVTDDGPRVVEFNARFGDPETQVILPRLATDLLDIFEACVDGRLAEQPVEWLPTHAVCVVMASGGYPGEYKVGLPIRGIGEAEAGGAVVFQAGTKAGSDGGLLTAGGRVLGVVGMGATTQEALRAAYGGVGRVTFDGAEFRKDIAWQVVGR